MVLRYTRADSRLCWYIRNLLKDWMTLKDEWLFVFLIPSLNTPNKWKLMTLFAYLYRVRNGLVAKNEHIVHYCIWILAYGTRHCGNSSNVWIVNSKLLYASSVTFHTLRLHELGSFSLNYFKCGRVSRKVHSLTNWTLSVRWKEI